MDRCGACESGCGIEPGDCAAGRSGAAVEAADYADVGTIEGGTSVNAIPEQVAARFDVRSTDSEELIRLEVEIHRAVEDAVIEANEGVKREHALRFSIETIGDRPAGALAEDAMVFENLRAVDRHLGIRTETRIASTDANIPLSLGVPALSLGAGRGWRRDSYAP